MRTTRGISTVRKISLLVTAVLILLSSSGCTFSLFKWPTGSETNTPPTVENIPTATPSPMAEVRFFLTLPAPLPAGQTLAISVLDEVTGLGLNATNYPMQSVDALNYSVTLPLPMSAVVKYRYMQVNGGILESTSANQPVRYRLYYVTGPGETHDILSSWSNQLYNGDIGSIRGQVLNIETSTPIPNLLVAAGGEQALTDSDGRFDLEGIPTGTHTVVVYSLDGSYRTFQQGATVAKDIATVVSVNLKQAPLVNVIFTVSVPKESVAGAPVRLAGNLIQLGNTYGNLTGGMSTTAGLMPVMKALPDGRYSLSINLPAGADVRYKYTLGDGFWNAEHRSNGEFQVRQMIVPESNTVVQDAIQTWQASNSAPILFDVTVPSNTPAGDIVYIQFNPYGWTGPIPMWPLGNNRWAYKLYSPLNMLGSFGYRYCRNAQCGSADDIATAGTSTPGRIASTSLTPQEIQDTVNAWAWLQNTTPAPVVGADISPRQSGFITSVEFQSNWSPDWISFTPQAMQNVQALNSKWVFLTPTWSFSRQQPLVFSPIPGKDQLWSDTSAIVSQARALNLNVALFAQPRFPTDTAEWWKSAPRDGQWWQTWFELYREFAINYADLASRSGAQALILGGDQIGPAMPGGLLSDGSPSGVPDDAENRWRLILADVRARFKGPVLWAQPYQAGQLDSAPTFLKETDGIYLLWSAPLAQTAATPKEDMVTEAGRLLDEEVAVFQSALGKPIIIGMAYPSIDGTATDCLPGGAGTCLTWQDFNRPNPDIATVKLNLQAQNDAYEALLMAINSRVWVAGVVSRGYYPPALLQDKSASVHGKPAADLLWYWYPRLLGITQ